jgi:hypothetical protein
MDSCQMLKLRGFLSFRDFSKFHGRYKTALREIEKKGLMMDYDTRSLYIYGKVIENESEFLRYFESLQEQVKNLLAQGQRVNELMQELNLYEKIAIHMAYRNLPIVLAISGNRKVDRILEKNGFVSLEKLVGSK